ncbi:MAG: hypothetical protein JSW27_17925 [Phycisphaerales bacterium]|nr:MAG: hypothetical protein JSW27_17925 [Phycisphaerales bacterium]
MKCTHADKAIAASVLSKMLVTSLLLSCRVTAVRAADSNPRVDDVLVALTSIVPTPRSVPCDAGDFAVPSGGHLQGIQQATIAGQRFAILSGSARESYLALIALEEDAGRVVKIKPLLPRPFKHAGGFQVCGDYLAVGIEDDNTKMASRIWILKLSDLLQTAVPTPIIEIERHGAYKRATAGAVGMAKVGSRHLLCVGTWDSATIDLYVSNGKALDDPACAFASRETWDAKQADRSNWSDGDFASYQNLNLVVDTSDRVLLIGFAHTRGSDVADVFELHMEPAVPVAKRLEKRHRHILHGQNTSFRHGAGLTVVDAETLTVLSCGYQKFVIERFEPPRR